jgi:hypothetical protein
MVLYLCICSKEPVTEADNILEIVVRERERERYDSDA